MLIFKKNSFKKDKKFAAGTQSPFRPRLLCAEQLENRVLLDAVSLDLAALINQGYNSASSDNTVYVTSLNDSATNVDDGLITLREALKLVKAETVIKFAVSGTINLVDKLSVDKSITIDASSQPTVTLNGNAACSIMEIGNRGDVASSPTSVTLKNISFYNGKTDGVGGALNISYYSNVNIDSCFFLSNTSKDHGGAIYSYSYNDIQISNTLFQNNTSTNGSGGAIYADTLTNGTFFITSSQFKNNSAGTGSGDYQGGALYLTSASTELETICASIDKCQFTGNHAIKGGAAAFGDSLVSVSHSLFEANSAEAYGGALYQDLIMKYLNLSETNFKNNTANSAGGAFYINSGIVQAQNNAYCGNAALDGGALYIYGGKSHNVLTSNYYSLADQFDANKAILNSKGYSGGAILSEGTLNLTNAVFTNNEALGDGGAILNKGKLTLDQAIFSGNKAAGENGYGGAIRCGYEDTSIISINNCLFMNNYATERGGAIDMSIGKIVIKNTLFQTNSTDTSSKNFGGAIYAYDSVTQLDIINCCFTENKSYQGSTIYDATLLNEGKQVLNITSSDFYADNIDKDGSVGGIYSAKGYVFNGTGMLASHTATLDSQNIYSSDFVLKDLNGNVINQTIFFNPISVFSDSGLVLYQKTFTLYYTGTESIILGNSETRVEGNAVKISGLTSGETINPGESRQITITISSSNQAGVNMERQNWRLPDGTYLHISAACSSVLTGNALLISEVAPFTNSNSLSSSYTVALLQQPTQDVTLYLRPQNGINLSVDKLVFTKENWNTPQTVYFSLNVNIISEKNFSVVTISHFWLENDADYQNADAAAAVSELTITVPDYVVIDSHKDIPDIPEETVSIVLKENPVPIIERQDYNFSQSKLSLFSVYLCNSAESLRFDWDDGMIENINISTSSVRQFHYYATPGNYQVSLTVYYRDTWNELQSATFILPVDNISASASAAAEEITFAPSTDSLSANGFSNSDTAIITSEFAYENFSRNVLGAALLLLENEEDNSKNSLDEISILSTASESVPVQDPLHQAREIALNELSILF